MIPKTGDTVRIVAGRHAGSTGVLTDVQRVDAPSGGCVFVAVVRRPRAGDTYCFATDLERVE